MKGLKVLGCILIALLFIFGGVRFSSEEDSGSPDCGWSDAFSPSG